MSFVHEPVLFKEVIDCLEIKKGDICIDGTVGGAGHSQEILKKITESGFLYGFDLDPEAMKVSDERLKKIGKNFQLINDNYSSLEKYDEKLGLASHVSGILLDLGVSSYEIREGRRGFSFQEHAEPLDMRMNPQNKLTAAEILNNWPEKEIERIIKEYGEESLAKLFAKKVIERRKVKKYQIVADLLQTIEEVYRGKRKPKRIHYATKIWQGLRIATNNELENLEKFLPQAIKCLKPGGRLAVISFHSLEDRIVKHYFKKESQACICPNELPVCQCHHEPLIKILTKKPIIPSNEEIQKNPQSRSAKLRVIEKIK